MKTRIFTLVLVALAFTTSSFASGIKLDVGRKVLTSFSSKFSSASEVTWSRTENYVKASFKMDGQYLYAYYMPAGDLIGVARNIPSTQLPLSLQSNLKDDYQGTWISELFEFSTQDETIYIATIENADEKMTIKSTTGHSWGIASRSKKP